MQFVVYLHTKFHVLDHNQYRINIMMACFAFLNYALCKRYEEHGRSVSVLLISKGKAIPLQAWTGRRFPGGRGSQIFRQSAHEGGKVVSPMHRPPLPPVNIPVNWFVLRGWIDPRAIVWLKRLCQWKILVTPLGIEPMTFQFVVQCLKQLRHSVPHYSSVSVIID
jgi:hypothetical protein